MIKITIKDELLDTGSPNFNQTLALDAFLAELRTATKTVVGDSIEYTGIAAEKLTLAKAQTLNSVNGITIEGFPTFIEIASEEAEVPVGVFGRTYLDEEEVEQVHTWNTWKLSNHTFMQLGDRLFLGSNAHTNEYLSLNQLDGVDLADIQTIKELQSEQPVEL